jgi:hypothetical protein
MIQPWCASAEALRGGAAPGILTQRSATEASTLGDMHLRGGSARGPARDERGVVLRREIMALVQGQELSMDRVVLAMDHRVGAPPSTSRHEK